ncbi:MAG: 5-(carboxyamino)imidazole ribonucleotide mutase [Firmicutes bacterium]|nr:5-(carboxyamino)imidazole ribonucleotide mutase [Bacillota bacterium]
MSEKAKVLVVYGSDSDLPVMKDALDFLTEMEISFNTTIVSAHRTPKKLFSFATDAVKNGYKVIIAGAGGSAHLPGMIASITPLPVIGVPIKTSTLSGVDSLHSIVQMPPGIPVATMAINGAKNAGILAMSILGTADKKYLTKVQSYKKSLEETVENKCAELKEIGYADYIKKNLKG